MNAIASFNLWEACMQTHSRQNGFPLPSIRGNAHRPHGEKHNFEVPAIHNDPPTQSNKETCATDLIQTFHKPAHHIHNSFHFAFVQAQHTLLRMASSYVSECHVNCSILFCLKLQTRAHCKTWKNHTFEATHRKLWRYHTPSTTLVFLWICP